MKALLIVLFAATSACTSQDANKINIDSPTIKTDSISINKDTISNSASNESVSSNSGTNDSTIHISFPKDSTWVTVNGKMKGINHPVTVFIPVKQGKQLTATILPEDSLANIRINQIFTPDGKADGPFGRELKRTIKQQGTYKLVIAENMMQGEEWKGKFKLIVKVE
ncbi:MAG: hypothetical protein WKG06_18460 [Segetibacter sp.]